jgi:hypothetical protein
VRATGYSWRSTSTGCYDTTPSYREYRLGRENALKMYVHPTFTPIVGSTAVRPAKAAIADARLDEDSAGANRLRILGLEGTLLRGGGRCVCQGDEDRH